MDTIFPIFIKKIIDELNNITNLDSDIVADIVAHNKLSEKELLKYSYFSHCKTESYGRKLICDSGKFKLLLMSWRPGDFTAIHNHGSTEWGCVHFFGEATHRLYRIENEKLELVTKECFQDGQNAGVCGNLTHIMGNASKKEFTTLHIYGSNSRISNISDDALVFVPEKKKKVTTSGSAYLDMDETLKKSEVEFTNISMNALMDYFDLITPFYLRNKRADIIQSIKTFQKNPEIFYGKNIS